MPLLMSIMMMMMMMLVAMLSQWSTLWNLNSPSLWLASSLLSKPTPGLLTSQGLLQEICVPVQASELPLFSCSTLTYNSDVSDPESQVMDDNAVKEDSALHRPSRRRRKRSSLSLPPSASKSSHFGFNLH